MIIMKNTTVAITEQVKQKLNLFGNKGETYNEIIEMLVETAEKSEFFEKQKRILATEKFVNVDEI